MQGLLSQFDQYDQNEMHGVEEQEVKSIAQSERCSNLRREQTWVGAFYLFYRSSRHLNFLLFHAANLLYLHLLATCQLCNLLIQNSDEKTLLLTGTISFLSPTHDLKHLSAQFVSV